MEKDGFQLANTIDYLKARLDRSITELFRLEMMKSFEGEGSSWEEIHMRGGRRIGIKSPSGSISIMHSEDIIHQYDPLGRLMDRRRFKDLPEGYVRLSNYELDEHNRSFTVSPTDRGMINF